MSYPKNRPANMSDFESLIKTNNIRYDDRWKPHYVNQFEYCLKQGCFDGMNKELRKNIAYCLQYLEYIQLQYTEIKLHDIIATHLIKTYIVTAMGIIEGIFYHLLKSKGLYRKEEWEKLGNPIHTNQFDENGIIKKYTITIYEKLKLPTDGEMDFEAMINKIQDKKLLNLSGKAFPYIKQLKRLRNKVHLQINKHDNDTDYMDISWYDYTMTRYILYRVLTDPIFKPDKEHSYFDFILPSEEELSHLQKHIDEVKKAKEIENNGQA